MTKPSTISPKFLDLVVETLRDKRNPRRRVKYRKKTSLIEATQWFKNGDHPQDESEPIEGSDKLSEGKVVGFFRPLDVIESLDVLGSVDAGNRFCSKCGNLMRKHGVLDGVNGEEYVCPSDYIVTDRTGLYYRLSRGEFESQYERYVRPPRFTAVPPSDLEEYKQRRKSIKRHEVS